MNEFAAIVSEQASQQSVLELIAVLLSMAYPFLAARQNILCWPAALFSTTIYVWIFWEVSLPFNSALNAYYMVMAIYGWVTWRKGSNEAPLPVIKWPLIIHIIAVSLLIICGFLLTHLVTLSWQGTHLYLDAMVTVFSVYATYLMVNKVLENWLFWIVINSFAMFLYFSHDLFMTALLFCGYFFASLYGYYKWKQSLKSQVEANAR